VPGKCQYRAVTIARNDVRVSAHTAQDVGRIAAEVNNRPRKTLGWQRPAELFAATATPA
jgi:IS30 family transposase